GAGGRGVRVGAAGGPRARPMGVLGGTPRAGAGGVPAPPVSTQSEAPADSGLVACGYPLSTQAVTAADYQQVRAEFAGSRWPDLRTAGTAYVDLAVQLLNGPYSDGYETVWFYQRLSAACAKHGK